MFNSRHKQTGQTKKGLQPFCRQCIPTVHVICNMSGDEDGVHITRIHVEQHVFLLLQPESVVDGEPLSKRFARQRWTMQVHILRMAQNTPAQRAIEFAINGSRKYQGRRGRHCMNLIETIQADVRQAGLVTLRTTTQLNRLRRLAEDKDSWRAKKKD